MFRRRQRIRKAAKKAAWPLAGCVVFILGTTGLILQSTVWKQPDEAADLGFYEDLPGVDLRQVASGRLLSLLKRLNAQHCSCGCMRTVAGCRNHHVFCTDSIDAARSAIAAARK